MKRLIAVAAAGGLLLAGIGVAAAQTAGTNESESVEVPAWTPEAGPAVPGLPMPGAFAGGDQMFVKGHPRGGPGAMRFRFGPTASGIHGESTAKDPDGEGYRTTAHQVGEVTEVSSSSITLKSEDGYERTYGIDEDTLVNAGRDGVGDVKTGDDARVMAVVEGDKARALNVIDETNLRRIGEKSWPKPKRGK